MGNRAPAQLSRRAVLAVALVAALTTLTTSSAGAETLVPVARVNFSNQAAAIPAGYVRDHGQAYTNARGLGWVAMSSSAGRSMVGNGRERNLLADQRRDTFVHMQLPAGSAGVTGPGRWEHALPAGTYQVTVVVGDAGPYYDSAHSLSVEGTAVIDRFVPTSATRFRTATTRVRVADGRLTLSPAGGTNTKLAFVDIDRVDADSSGPPVPPSPPAATVTLRPSVAGAPVHPDTQGLSFEVLDMILPQFSGGNLAQHLRSLGPGTLRIGGNSADQTFWTSTGETAPSWATGTVTPAALARLAGLSAATGWDVILTVNLKRFDPARAADEVAAARAALGDALQAVEIGNEPNFYYSDTARFWADYQTYRQAILARTPGVPIVGPGAAFAAPAFHNAFVNRQAAAPDVAALTRHFYPLSACNGATPTLAQLLSSETYTAQKAAARAVAADAARLGVPGLMDETNNVVCQGQPGVSDVFASSLWVLRHAAAVSAEGVRTLHVHGNVRQCATAKPHFMYYTPLCAPTAADFAAGRLVAQPSYYGLLAFRALGTGTHIGVDNAAWATLHAFAVRDGDGVRLALINVQDPATTGPRQVSVQLGATFTSARRVDLAAPGGLRDTVGTTFGGQRVRGDGTVAAPASTTVPITGGRIQLSVPAGSATIVTLR